MNRQGSVIVALFISTRGKNSAKANIQTAILTQIERSFNSMIYIFLFYIQNLSSFLIVAAKLRFFLKHQFEKTEQNGLINDNCALDKYFSYSLLHQRRAFLSAEHAVFNVNNPKKIKS
jgi:hypothetical protein